MIISCWTISVLFLQGYFLIASESPLIVKINIVQFYGRSRVVQWKRAGPITQRSVDRNHALLYTFLWYCFEAGNFNHVLELISSLWTESFQLYFKCFWMYVLLNKIINLQSKKDVLIASESTLIMKINIIQFYCGSRVAQWKLAEPI